MRTILAAGIALAIGCGGQITNDSGDNDSDSDTSPDACVGLECEVAKCTGAGQQPTTITGTVFAPNGTLPLYGADVYVPRDALPPIVDGVVCGQCQDLPGSPIAATKSGTNGEFTLVNVPAGQNIPLVVSIGKWRRQITIPAVAECTTTAVGSGDTRLPRTKAEGDLPKIAVTTGNADSLECLFRKMGIDDSEITTSAGAGRVNLYNGNGGNQFAAGFAGGSGALPSATPFWASAANLNQYDIVVLSCEGNQNGDTKPQAALNALKSYADGGGRVFTSHWHNIWIGGDFQGGDGQSVPAWENIASWSANTNNPPNPTTATIDQNDNPKGAAFAEWMVNVGGSTTPGVLPITQARITSTALVDPGAEQWVYLTGQQGGNGNEGVQNFQFTTPYEGPPENRCGKVVFSDMHVSGTVNGTSYPSYCDGGPLTPQEKALIFMLFDIASCVSVVL